MVLPYRRYLRFGVYRVRLRHASLDAKESSMSKTTISHITPPVAAEATTAAASAEMTF
jgi:hypothetical protein